MIIFSKYLFPVIYWQVWNKKILNHNLNKPNEAIYGTFSERLKSLWLVFLNLYLFETAVFFTLTTIQTKKMKYLYIQNDVVHDHNTFS